MAAPEPVMALPVLLTVIGALCLTWGLCTLLLPRSVMATHAGSPSFGPPGSDPAPSPMVSRPDGPQNLGPAAYQALVLAPAGRWGNYFQEIGRCQHRHSTADGAYDCACALPLAGRPDGALVAVGPAE